jgi:hypothetical protein
LYVNGACIGATPCNGWSPSGYNLLIGRYSPSATYYFNGNMATVRIYNRSLSTQEIRDNYNLDAWKAGMLPV